MVRRGLNSVTCFCLIETFTKTKHGKYSFHRKVKISYFDKESTMHVVRHFPMPYIVLLAYKSLGNNEFIFLGTITPYANLVSVCS